MSWHFEQVEGSVYRLQNLLTHKPFQPEASAAAEAGRQPRPLAANQASQ